MVNHTSDFVCQPALNCLLLRHLNNMPTAFPPSSLSSCTSGSVALSVSARGAEERRPDEFGFSRYGGGDACVGNIRGGRRASLTTAALLLASPAFSAVALPSLAQTKSGSGRSPYDEKRLLEQNRKIQEANNAPDDFPTFIRLGFEVKVVISDNYTRSDSGLIYRDIRVGEGNCPKDGQQLIFHYIGYNESGRRIDSTYNQGSPAKIRLGNKTLVPGFEEGIREMKPGGKRRIIIPPELGPPVGPSTFFSAKQYEVFDIELLRVEDCQRRTIAFYSDVVCN